MTIPCRLSETAYLTYSQLPSILQVIPPTATRGGAMSWWQGPTYHSVFQNYFKIHVNIILPLMAKTSKSLFSSGLQSRFLKVYGTHRLRWSRGSVLAFSTQVSGFKPGRSRRIFKGKKILSTPSFRGEVKPSVPCRRFVACKRSLNGVEVVISAKLRDNILAHSSHFRRWDLSRRGGRAGTWWWKVGTSKKRGKAMANYP